MPTTIAPAVNLLVGTGSIVAPPSFADVGNAVVACIIFNNTSSILVVTGSFGQGFLQPNTADLFPCPGIVSAPTVATTAIAPMGTFVGTVQAIFYFEGDRLPTNYPIVLNPFAGGANLLITSIGNTAVPVPFTILPPFGTGTLTFNATTAITNLSVTGVQTGRTYASGVSIAANSTKTLTLFNSGDTSYSIGLSGQLDSVAAGPAISAPTDAISSFGASTTATLAAASGGAYYLYGADLINSGASECAVQIEAPTGTIIGWLGTTVAQGAGGTDHVQLNGYRTTGAITLTFDVAGTSPSCTLRYTSGP